MTYTPSTPTTYETSGTLVANGETVILFAPNCGSATITIDGTFTGNVTVTGANESGGIEGGRLLFQSGVGSIGDNIVRNAGSLIQREYRILAGGDYIIVRASSWSSGSCRIFISAQAQNNIQFINGPVHDTFEEAQRNGRGFSVGSGVRAVTNNNFLQARFNNPTGNNRLAFVTLRLFTNNQTSSPPELSFYPTFPTVLTGATTVAPNNLRPDRAASSMEFAYRTSGTTLGAAPLQQILPLNGTPFSVEVTRIVPPGSSFAYQIGGAGGGVNNALRASMAFVWYEEALQ